MSDGVRVERLSGAALQQYVPQLAQLRIEVFRDFPYLYEGDLDYEARYLRTYIDSPDSVIVLVFDGERVVGASTALPMAHETEEFQRPFLDHGYDPSRIFYLGESVLQRGYRGRGLGVRFFEEREAHARALGGFELACFCAVQRPADHPRRPAGYQPLDTFWGRRGYTRHPELVTHYRWRDIGETEETAKPMMFWLKPLGPANP